MTENEMTEALIGGTIKINPWLEKGCSQLSTNSAALSAPTSADSAVKKGHEQQQLLHLLQKF